jgi:hypothetical protein
MDGRACFNDDGFKVYGTTNQLIAPLPLTRFSARSAPFSALLHALAPKEIGQSLQESIYEESQF